jgi:hypothetical protein
MTTSEAKIPINNLCVLGVTNHLSTAAWAADLNSPRPFLVRAAAPGVLGVRGACEKGEARIAHTVEKDALGVRAEITQTERIAAAPASNTLGFAVLIGTLIFFFHLCHSKQLPRTRPTGTLTDS